jgi:hypothetical protein
MKHKIDSLLLCPAAMTIVLALIGLPQTKLLAADNGGKIFIDRKIDDDGKPGKKEHSFKNQNVVKVFPDPIKKTIHVVARTANEKEIDFLVFDINGNMVLNYKMKAGEKRSISNLKKGAYMYHVFSEDEYLTTGKIEFR